MSKRERLYWKGFRTLFGIVFLVVMGSVVVSLIREYPYRLYLVWRMRRTVVDLMVARAVFVEVGRFWLGRAAFRSNESVNEQLSSGGDDGARRGFAEEFLDSCGVVAEYGNTFLPAILACSIVIGLTSGVAVTVSGTFSCAFIDLLVRFPMRASERVVCVGGSFAFLMVLLSWITRVRSPAARAASWLVGPFLCWIAYRFCLQAMMGLYPLRDALPAWSER